MDGRYRPPTIVCSPCYYSQTHDGTTKNSQCRHRAIPRTHKYTRRVEEDARVATTQAAQPTDDARLPSPRPDAGGTRRFLPLLHSPVMSDGGMRGSRSSHRPYWTLACPFHLHIF